MLHHAAPFTDLKHVSRGAVTSAHLPPSNRLSCFNLENIQALYFTVSFFNIYTGGSFRC